MNWRPRIGIAFLVLIATTVSGCALSRLDNGNQSAMDASFNQLRNSIVIDPSSPVLHMRYHLRGQCRYKETAAGPDGTSASEAVVVFTPRRDKTFISTMQLGHLGGYTGSEFASIDRTGRLIDFNSHIVGRGLSATVTPQTARRIAQELIQKEANRQKNNIFISKNSIHELNDISIDFPHYISDAQYVGSVVAYVSIEGGGIYGPYIYRGITDYQGHRAALLDLMRTMPDLGSSPVTTGFGLFDISTGLPLLVVVSAGFTTVGRLITCRP